MLKASTLGFRNRTLVLLALALVSVSAFSLFSATPSVQAADKNELCAGANLDITGNSQAGCGAGSVCTGSDTSADSCPGTKLNSVINTVVNILSTIVGVAAVIMIIYGGFRYVTSGGDSGAVGTAKNTIIYALVGLVIVALAQFIVKFVLSKAT